MKQTTFYIDVTQLCRVEFLTGIQRVVREIVLRMLQDSSLRVVLLCYFPEKHCFRVLSSQRFAAFYGAGKGSRTELATGQTISPDDFSAGSVFFDIDSVWNMRSNRAELFGQLRRRGVRIAVHLYDLIPITHPQYCHQHTVMRFMNYLGTNLQYADLFICSAQATKDALNDLTDRLELPRCRCEVVPLGADFQSAENKQKEKPDPDIVRQAQSGRYILMVGTIEPRKNHKLALDALDQRLGELGIHVIFAGRIGWNVEALKERIAHHPHLGSRLFFAENSSDATIDFLYKNALCVAFPTYNEGFGLPMIEAMQRGTPVVASDIGVLREVGGEFVDYFDPDSVDAFSDCVLKLATDSHYYAAKKAALRDYTAPSWDAAASHMTALLKGISAEEGSLPAQKVRQMVVLSARPDDLLKTLPFLDRFLPFIEELVVCCPERVVETLRSGWNGRIQLVFLTDDEILAGRELPEDHTHRNFFLRCLAMEQDKLDDVFLMTDDDYRPLCTISEEMFLSGGKYHGYYCYDLCNWQGTYGNYTSYDRSMFRTREFLQENGYPTLQYSSHQPQIIDRRIYLEMLKAHPEISVQGLDEWSTYFNYGIAVHPSRFCPEVYCSMGWPGARSDWDLAYQPQKFLFENYYSSLYEENRVFCGFSQEYHPDIEQENLQKVVRYAGELQKQMEGRRVYAAYEQAYRAKYGVMPSFVLRYEPESDLHPERFVLHTPLWIQMAADVWQRIPITFDRSLSEYLGNGKILMQHYFASESGQVLGCVGECWVDPSDLGMRLPVRTLEYPMSGSWNLNFILDAKKLDVHKTIPCTISP